MKARLKTSLYLLAMAVMILPACGEPDRGDSGPTPNGATPQPDAGHEIPDADEAEPDAEPTPQPDVTTPPDNGTPGEGGALTGRWAMKLVTSSLAEIPFAGTTTSTSVALLRVDITQEGESLTLVSKTCALEIDSGSALAETVIPDAFVEGLEISTREATVTENGGVFNVSISKHYAVLGARLDDPAEDPLPTEEIDPRIWDQDGDGNPGMTIRVTGSIVDGEIYLVQRGWDAMEGAGTASRIRGLVDWEQEQVILGSDNPILALNQPESERNSDAEAHPWQMVPISAGDDCAKIVAQASSLFD